MGGGGFPRAGPGPGPARAIMTISRPRGEAGTLRRFARYVLRYKLRFVYAVVCSGLISITSLLLLTLLKPAVETIFSEPASGMARAVAAEPGRGLLEPSGQLGALLAPVYHVIGRFAQNNRLLTLGMVCLFILLLVIVNGIFRYIQEYMVKWIGNRTILDLQRDLFEHMLHFDAAYFARHKVGALISYFTVDTRKVGETVFDVFGRLLLDPCMILAALVFLLYMQWKLTLLYALIFPFIYLTIRFFSQKSRRAGRRAQEIMSTMGAFLQEHFSSIRLVQGYAMDERQKRLFWKEARGVFDASMSLAKSMGASSPISELIGVFALCCVLLLGGFIMFRQEGGPGVFDGGDFLVFIATLGFIYQPVKRMERTIQQIQQGLAAADRVFAVLDTDARLPQAADPLELERFENEIRFDEVSFTYDGQTPVLDRVSFTARKGEQIALVGPSGAGKTTLVNLIPRIYDPTGGRILLDGHDLRAVRLDSLRRLISTVHQDVMILADTVRVNITCGNESFTPEQIEAAARAAGADEFIAALPQGYDTIVGERGESLSGGQCQRLAIARAFLRDSPILILDEATSSLDSESERHIKESLRLLMRGRTVFVIAHRLSTILQADRILVLDRGTIVDIGAHAELLDRCALYQRLYHLQFHE